MNVEWLIPTNNELRVVFKVIKSCAIAKLEFSIKIVITFFWVIDNIVVNYDLVIAQTTYPV
jgi:hypothetical protein